MRDSSRHLRHLGWEDEFLFLDNLFEVLRTTMHLPQAHSCMLLCCRRPLRPNCRRKLRLLKLILWLGLLSSATLWLDIASSSAAASSTGELAIASCCVSTTACDCWGLTRAIGRHTAICFFEPELFSSCRTLPLLRWDRKVPEGLSASLLFRACSECQLMSQLLQLKHRYLSSFKGCKDKERTKYRWANWARHVVLERVSK